MAALLNRALTFCPTSAHAVSKRKATSELRLPSPHTSLSLSAPCSSQQCPALKPAKPQSVSSRGRSLSPVAETAAEPQQETGTRYYFVVANAKFMLDEEEHFQEQLKERRRWLQERGHENNFWLLFEPDFLDMESFADVTRLLKRPAVALVSTDKDWIKFLKLRLDRVLEGEFDCDSQSDALKAKPVTVEFDTPQNWVAPYKKYPKDWWKPYVPN